MEPNTTPKNADELFQDAVTLIEKDQANAAISLLRKAARLDPRQARIHHYLGYALWKCGDLDSAAPEFEKALRIEPGNPYSKYFLARIYSRDRLERAVELYEEITRSGKVIFDSYQRLGQVYFNKGELKKALEMMQLALSDSPLDGAIHYLLGKIYRQLGRLGEAQQEFETAERLKRADRVAIQKLTDLSELVRSNQSAEVPKLSRELLDEASEDPDILMQLGILLGQGGFVHEALRPLQFAAERMPDAFEAHFNLGLTLAKLEQTDKAEASLKRSIELRPDSFEANSTLAFLYVNQNRTEEAIQRLEAARKARPENLRVLALLGQQYLQAGRPEQAAEILRLAVRLRPDDPQLQSLLARANHRNSIKP
jgi:Flp pilus assembly protein TadD